MGDAEKLLTYLNSALKVLLGLDIFPCVPKKVKFCCPVLLSKLVILEIYPANLTFHFILHSKFHASKHRLRKQNITSNFSEACLILP